MDFGEKSVPSLNKVDLNKEEDGLVRLSFMRSEVKTLRRNSI